MKKIFGDTIVSKLRNIPSFVWVILLFASFFFANAYSCLLNGEYFSYETISAYDKISQQTGQDINLNPIAFGIIFSLAYCAINLVIFEIIIGFVYNTVAGRFRAQINRADFKFRLRYLMILSNVIVGILSIGYFFTQRYGGVYTGKITFFNGSVNLMIADNPYASIQSAILPFTVTTILLGIFYEDFRERYVPRRNQASLFSFGARIYFGVYIALLLISILRDFVLYKTEHTVYDIVGVCLDATIKIALAVVAFFNAKRLKKISDSDESEIHIHTDDGNDNIFGDYGF